MIFFEFFDDGAFKVGFGDDFFVAESLASVFQSTFDEDFGGAGRDTESAGVGFKEFCEGFGVEVIHIK